MRLFLWLPGSAQQLAETPGSTRLCKNLQRLGRGLRKRRKGRGLKSSAIFGSRYLRPSLRMAASNFGWLQFLLLNLKRFAENVDFKNYWMFDNFCHRCFHISWWPSVKESMEGLEIWLCATGTASLCGESLLWDRRDPHGVMVRRLLKLELCKARGISNLTPWLVSDHTTLCFFLNQTWKAAN